MAGNCLNTWYVLAHLISPKSCEADTTYPPHFAN